MIILIDNYDSFTYNLYQQIAQFYGSVKVFRNDHITIKEIASFKPIGIVLSPGPGRPENAGICIELIQSLQNIPVLGVCLGHQAIVSAFGGNIIGASEIVHGKSEKIFHTRQSLYQNMPLPFEAGRYHSLMTDKNALPDNLIIEAENAAGLIMGIRHKNLPLYGTQFHPESILTPQGALFMQNFINICRKTKSCI